VQRKIGCGFNPGFAHFARKHDCGPNVLRSGDVHNYPIVCPPPKIITIDRVVQVEGVDNALFLVGDVEGYRMNRNFMCEIPGDAINVVSGNFPSYLLLKNGNLHTLGFSTANIEAVLRQNRHMFSRDGVLTADLELFPELAPQDTSVEGMGAESCCKPERHFKYRVVSNATLNDCSTTIEIIVYECEEVIDREIWYLIPVRAENGNTIKGFNWAAWDDSPRTFGEAIFIPGRSTENGQFILANYPTCYKPGLHYAHINYSNGCCSNRGKVW